MTTITVVDEEGSGTNVVVGHMELEAKKRKERLQSLKRKLDPNSVDCTTELNDSSSTAPSLPK